MNDFVEWKPEFDGHKPPRWRKGMKWNFWPKAPTECSVNPSWVDDTGYSVPREAVVEPSAKEFVIWQPELIGHEPPHWREGMEWSHWPVPPPYLVTASGAPTWRSDKAYSVPREAVYGPAEKLLSWTETTAAVAKRTLSNASLSDLKQALSKHSAEELAEHGITLAPEKDWATELWADALEAWGFVSSADRIRDGLLIQTDEDAIELIRSRMPKEEVSDV